MEEREWSSISVMMQNPTEVSFSNCGGDLWLTFKDGFIDNKIFICLPHILFQLRHVVEQMIKEYMEDRA